MKKIFSLSILLVILTRCKGADLYRVLGVSRTADMREIKSAYKELAKIWHPDKNRSPEAQEKITELNRAYEILSDEEKRERYDHHGDTGDHSSGGQGHYGSHFSTVFRTPGFSHFTSGGHQADDISTTFFFNEIVPNSGHKPYVLNFYHSFCMECMFLRSTWERLKGELTRYDDLVGFGSVNTELGARVPEYCGVSHVPSMVVLVSGRTRHLRLRGLVSVGEIKNLIHGVIPSHVTDLTKANFRDFLSLSIARNKPRLVFVSPGRAPSLFYKLLAFGNRESVDFARVNSEDGPKSNPLLGELGVVKGGRKALLYKEEGLATSILKGSEVSITGLQSLLSRERFLYMPRLSAPRVFDAVFPYDGAQSVCVLLVVDGESAYSDPVTGAMRQVARRATSSSGRAGWKGTKFAYVDRQRQEGFVNSFSPVPVTEEQRVCPGGHKAVPVLVFRRKTSNVLAFNWFKHFCGLDADQDGLRSFVSGALLSTSTQPEPLLDEEAPGWLEALLNNLLLNAEYVSDFVHAANGSLLNPFTSLVLFLLVFCMLSYLLSFSEGQSEFKSPVVTSRQPKVLTLFQLSHQHYRNFVERSPKHVVTFVLVVDNRLSRNVREMKQTFATTVNKYMTSSAILCYLDTAKYSRWFPALLGSCKGLSCDEKNKRLKLNNDGDVPSIIAIHGVQRKVTLFPEHQGESSEGGGREKRGKAVEETLSGAFGFDVDEEETENSDPSTCTASRHMHCCLEQNGSAKATDGLLLESPSGFSVGTRTRAAVPDLKTALSLWLEKLSDGSLKWFTVEEWPHLR